VFHNDQSRLVVSWQRISTQQLYQSHCNCSTHEVFFAQPASFVISTAVSRDSPNYCSTESESYVTTEGQSASLSWNKAPIWCLRPDIYYFLTISGLLLWSALSDEMTGLSFVHATDPRQRSASWVRVPLFS
jgi:hypothetical protein